LRPPPRWQHLHREARRIDRRHFLLQGAGLFDVPRQRHHPRPGDGGSERPCRPYHRSTSRAPRAATGCRDAGAYCTSL
jgi:hypothetical protein